MGDDRGELPTVAPRWCQDEVPSRAVCSGVVGQGRAGRLRLRPLLRQERARIEDCEDLSVRPRGRKLMFWFNYCRANGAAAFASSAEGAHMTNAMVSFVSSVWPDLMHRLSWRTGQVRRQEVGITKQLLAFAS